MSLTHSKQVPLSSAKKMSTTATSVLPYKQFLLVGTNFAEIHLVDRSGVVETFSRSSPFKEMDPVVAYNQLSSSIPWGGLGEGVRAIQDIVSIGEDVYDVSRCGVHNTLTGDLVRQWHVMRSYNTPFGLLAMLAPDFYDLKYGLIKKEKVRTSEEEMKFRETIKGMFGMFSGDNKTDDDARNSLSGIKFSVRDGVDDRTGFVLRRNSSDVQKYFNIKKNSFVEVFSGKNSFTWLNPYRYTDHIFTEELVYCLRDRGRIQTIQTRDLTGKLIRESNFSRRGGSQHHLLWFDGDAHCISNSYHEPPRLYSSRQTSVEIPLDHEHEYLQSFVAVEGQDIYFSIRHSYDGISRVIALNDPSKTLLESEQYIRFFPSPARTIFEKSELN